MAGKKLGIYFGKEGVSMVEVMGRRIVSQLSLPLENIPPENKEQSEVSESILGYEDTMLTAMIEAALKDNRIEAKKTYLGLSDKDQIIRGFQMWSLNKSEMDTGVLFEVKKYLPYKTEDLVFDYQRRINKKSAKMDVLFVGATRNTLESRLSMVSQSGLEIAAVEPASFSLLRILSLTKQLNPNLSLALVTVQGLDVEFTIIDKGFPSFSRDIRLPQLAARGETAEGTEESSILGRLSSEVRVSLDYFRRQLLGNPIDKILFLSKDIAMQDKLISGLSQDLGLTVERVELEKDQELLNSHNLDVLKAYALALKDSVKLNLTVDLAKKKSIQPIVEKGQREIKPARVSLRMLKWSIVLALAGMVWSYLPTRSKVNQANVRLGKLSGELEAILPAKLKGLSFDSWKNEKIDYNSKIELIEKLLKSRFNLLPSLNVLPQAIEPGVWLENLSISLRDGRVSLSLKGTVYLGERSAQANAANDFYQALKSNPDFMRSLRNLELRSLSEGEAQIDKDKYPVTYFEISGS